jgi:xylulokinase
MLCGLADGIDALVSQGLQPGRVLLIGGAAQSAAVQQVAPDVFGVPVAVPAPGEYVALGAARQAASALAGDGQVVAAAARSAAYDVVHEPTQVERGAEIRAAYRTLRETMHPHS